MEVRGRAGTGRKHDRLFLSGCGQHRGGDQLGHSCVVVSVRLGQDVGNKVGAGRSSHDDDLIEENTFKTLQRCVERGVKEA